MIKRSNELILYSNDLYMKNELKMTNQEREDEWNETKKKVQSHIETMAHGSKSH